MLLSGVLVLASACTPTPAATPAPGPYDAACRQAVEAVRALPGRSNQTPEHLIKQPEAGRRPGDFDANTYFTALTHLSMTEGYALDYRYQSDTLGGFPLLYARRLDGGEPAGDSNYRQQVKADGSAEGYLELAVLDVMAAQFYLVWHANYNDRQIVCDRTALEDLVSHPNSFNQMLPDDVQVKARQLDVAPAVELGEKEVRVSVVTFTNWGGFKRLTLTFERAFPHTATSQEDILVPYDCGVMF
jgi:hypothetical protein